jgi:hypothetical protein
VGEIEDQVAAAHACEIYLLVLECGVGTLFGPDLHAGVEAEASRRWKRCPKRCALHRASAEASGYPGRGRSGRGSNLYWEHR